MEECEEGAIGCELSYLSDLNEIEESRIEQRSAGVRSFYDRPCRISRRVAGEARQKLCGA